MTTIDQTLKNDNELYMLLKNNFLIKNISNYAINNFIKKFDWFAYNQYKDNSIVFQDFYTYYRGL